MCLYWLEIMSLLHHIAGRKWSLIQINKMMIFFVATVLHIIITLAQLMNLIKTLTFIISFIN